MRTNAPLFDKRKDILGLAGFLALTFVVSSVGGAVTAGSVGTWYAALAKPAFNPPDWIFGPVWSVLYALMAIAAWRVWRLRGFSGAKPEMAWFLAQLALNGLWSILFFGLHRIGLALIDILFLLAAILVTAALFWRRDRLAGAFFVPYAVWVAFAALLNAAIWRLN